MKKKLWLLCIIILLIVTAFSGCQEQKALTAGEKSGQVKLRSSVVELYKSSFNINTISIKDNSTNEIYEKIENIEVKYLLKNIAGKPIQIEVSAEFYDKNDRLVGLGEEPRPSINLPKDYAEKVYTPQNSIIYAGSNVADVQYVVLIVEEKV
jgi:uncharacterized protein YnzC (UPF0291/DUF896 family)